MNITLFSIQPLELGGGWEQFLVSYAKCHLDVRPNDSIQIVSLSRELFNKVILPLHLIYGRKLSAQTKYRLDSSHVDTQCAPVSYYRCTSLHNLKHLLSTADVIYIKNEVFDLAYVRILSSLLRMNTPIIAGTHCAQVYPNPSSITSRSLRNYLYTSNFYYYCSTFVSAWHVMNRQSYNYIRHFHPAKPVSLVEYPFVELYAPRDSTEPTPSDQAESRIVWAGRMTEQKGIPRLISIMRALDGASLPIEWVIAGSGEDSVNLARYSPRHHRITLLGHISQSNLYKLLSESQIYLSTSLWESWPNLINEALHSGIQIVASDIPGHTDMLEGVPGTFLYSTVEQAVDILSTLTQRLVDRRAPWSPPRTNAQIVDQMYRTLFGLFDVRNT